MKMVPLSPAVGGRKAGVPWIGRLGRPGTVLNFLMS